MFKDVSLESKRKNYKMQKGDKLPNNFILVQKKIHRCQFRKQNVKFERT